MTSWRNRVRIAWLAVLAGTMAALPACDAPWTRGPDWAGVFVEERIVEWNLSIESEEMLKALSPENHTCDAEGQPQECGCDQDCPQGCRCELDRRACVPTYVEADLEVDGILYPAVGLWLMSGRDRAKPTWRIRFNQYIETQSFHGLKRLNLRNNANDPSLVREALALKLMRRAGVAAPRSSFVWLSINQEPGGLYALVQQVDRRFLDAHFGEDRGNLYKLEVGADLAYQGEDPAGYEPPFCRLYERNTNETSLDRGDIIRLMKILEGTPDEEQERELAGLLDVPRFLRMLAVNTWLSNMDSYQGSGDNLYLYRDAFGRFRTIPWDLNESFGNYSGTSCPTSLDLEELDPDAPTCGDPRPLVDRVLASEKFRKTYHDDLRELVDGVLHPDEVRVEMERLKWRIADRVTDDSLYQQDWFLEDFEASFGEDVRDRDREVWVPGLLPFVQARDKRVREALGGS